ncbi:bacterial dynamin-like protein [Mytilus galloprovincialis]|uniref:bacterial dynamin-like protein n=1 Tax=Mytilus galloprovincialis TaxID=29158 RepID=UPI003F7C1502
MLRVIFELVENMIKSEEYDKDLQAELAAAFPNYLNVLQTSKRDLLRNDCGIVVTGETSAGKTSVINKIIGRTGFATSNTAATGKVCRIRNSDDMQIKAYTYDEKLIKDEQVNDFKEFKYVMKTLTDLKRIPEELKDVFYVDAYLPVPLLQGNVILVDTPGIGESDELDSILLEFLPHAVSFLFIIDASHSGGVDKDRLMRILRNVMDNRSKMPCFNPEDVMFLTNKWDIIEPKEYSSTDEEDNTEIENQHAETFRSINMKLKMGWPHINPKNIFRISIRQADE